MPRLEPLTLVGRVVRLEPLDLGHVPALVDAASAARGTFLHTLVPEDAAGMTAYVSRALEDRARGTSLPFVVLDTHGEVVGTTRYLEIGYWTWPSAPPTPVPEGPDALEIGFTWYAERVQRTGVNTEAKLLLCAQAFEVWGVRCVTWRTDARNERSRAAILRLGAQFDGVLRAHRPSARGDVRDTACYSMLRAEWPEARRALVARLAR